MRAKIFIADQNGGDTLQNGLFQRIHIGSALGGSTHSAEVDSGYPGSISTLTSYADLRCLYHVWKRQLSSYDLFGFQQNRRMFLFPHLGRDQDPFDIKLAASVKSLNKYETWVDHETYARYLERCKTLTSNHIMDIIEPYSMIVNQGLSFHKESLEDQYLQSIRNSYPDDDRYLHIWFDFRTKLNDYFPSDTIDAALSGSTGYFNNMFIARKELFKQYCEIVFDLFGSMNRWDGLFRAFGYLGERLFTVFVYHQMKIQPQFRICELPIIVDADVNTATITHGARIDKGLCFEDGSSLGEERVIINNLSDTTYISPTLICIKETTADIDQPCAKISLQGNDARQFRFRCWATVDDLNLKIVAKSTGAKYIIQTSKTEKTWINLNLDPGSAFEIFLVDTQGVQLERSNFLVGADSFQVLKATDLGSQKTIATKNNYERGAYLKVNPDLEQAARNPEFDPLVHLLEYGVFEGRYCSKSV